MCTRQQNRLDIHIRHSGSADLDTIRQIRIAAAITIPEPPSESLPIPGPRRAA